MQKRRLISIAAGFFTMASIGLSPALADMFYYRDSQGQLHLTNVRSRIPSAYRSQADRNRRPEQGGPKQAVDKTVEKQPISPSQADQQEEMVQRASVASPQAMPVDARDFGLLSLRMSDFEVLQRLGPPAAISDVGERALPPEGSSHRVIRVTESTQSWYYPGTAGTPATRLDFQGGNLVNKTRLSR